MNRTQEKWNDYNRSEQKITGRIPMYS